MDSKLNMEGGEQRKRVVSYRKQRNRRAAVEAGEQVTGRRAGGIGISALELVILGFEHVW